jgi:tetratricopeptide (TPR) repeat protein
MSLSRLYRLLGLVAAVAFLTAPMPSYAQTGGVTGVVTLRDGSLCVGCQILIERQEIHGVYKTKTDKHGKYTYIGLPLGNYKITLEDPNGHPLFSLGNRHLGMGEPAEVNFNLPAEVQKQEATPEYKQQEAEQEKEQKQMAGLKQLFDQGNALLAENKFDEAAAKFKEAEPLAKGKNLVAVDGQLADAYAKSKKYDEAATMYQKVLELSPDNAGVHNNLGSLYAQMGKTDLAKAEFEKAAQLDPNGAARYYFNLGAILYNTGKMDDGAGAFKKATELDPKYADAYFWLGQCLLGKATTGEGGKVVAVPGTSDAFETYLKLDPNGPNAATAKALLQTLGGNVETQYVKKKRK